MRFEVKAVVFVKDMAFVDPDEAMPLSQIIDFYNHEVRACPLGTTVVKMIIFYNNTAPLSTAVYIYTTHYINESLGRTPSAARGPRVRLTQDF